MPFSYLGAKHRFARYYPAPAHDTIVEPFAGAAGYAVFWAYGHTVRLYDSDPNVIALWRTLQSSSALDVLDDAEAQLATRDRISNPFAYMSGGGLYRVRPGGSATKTKVMTDMWPGVRRRIEAALPRIATWHVEQSDWADVPVEEATWFVDPPYQSDQQSAGNRYGAGHMAKGIDYAALGDWCRALPGQAIVCEQHPAEWLPFETFREHRTRLRRGDPQWRREVVWRQGDESADDAVLRARAVGRDWARRDVYGPRHLRRSRKAQ